MSNTRATPAKKKADTVPMMVRLPRPLADKITNMAKDGDRTVSQQLHRIIKVGMANNNVQ